MKAQPTQDAANQPAPITTQVIEFYLMALAAARTPEEAKQKTAETFRAVNSHAALVAALEKCAERLAWHQNSEKAVIEARMLLDGIKQEGGK